jgi:3-isopropylmalate/(R)-2-methylmalate dehydratase small subunit
MTHGDATGPVIRRISGTAIPLRGDDIDTDQILPARFLTAISFQGMEQHVFVDACSEARAQGRQHPFADPRHGGATILLVDRNFGCGSSREHAPQGLRRHGIRALVGQSFGEIFAGNCLAIGMPCVEVTAAVAASLQNLVETEPAAVIEIDLVEQSIRAAGTSFPFVIGAGRRQQLLDGSWDATTVLLAAGGEIDAKMRGLSYGDLLPVAASSRRRDSSNVT